jgi:hypothetical protein
MSTRQQKIKPDGTPWLPKSQWKALQKKANGGAKQKKTGKKEKGKKKRRPAHMRFDANRIAANPLAQLVPMKTVSPAIEFVAAVNSRALRAAAIGWIATSLVRGAVARTSIGDIPNAYQYLCGAFAAAFSGQNYVSGNVPYWLRNILQALQPKSVPLDAGRASYSFAFVGNPPIAESEIAIGPTAWTYMWPFFLPNSAGTPVNGFPPCDIFSPGTYSTQGGSTSFQVLAELMANADRRNPMSQLVPATGETVYLKDVSAFAICKPELGYGFTGAGVELPGGCFSHNVQLEVPIFHPILACIGSGSSTDNRFPGYQQNFGGDPCFLTAASCGFLTPAEMAMKRPPKFHCVDFLEFCNVMALWVQGVQTSATNEDGSILPPGVTLQCPLTLQEMCLLLRNVMMNAFKDTQPAVQGLGPVKPQNINDNFFVPLQCAPGTAPITVTPMTLPKPIIENIRALVYRKLYPGKNQSAGDPLYFIPVLGKFVYDTLSTADYQYSDNEGNPVDSFKSPTALYARKVHMKGETVTQTLAETPIDFVDGNGGSQYVAINDPDRLGQLTKLWNDWLSQSFIQSHSCATDQWSTELGISALTSICLTRHQISSDSVERKMKKVVYQEHLLEDVRLRTMANKCFVAGPYAQRFALMDTSSVEILSSPYEAVLRTWVLPLNMVLEVSGPGSYTQSTKLQRMQGYERETFSQALTTTDQGMEVSSMHAQYAAKMVKSRLSAQTQWDEFFLEMEKLGRGGILSSLVGGIVKGVFPGTSQIVDQIAPLIPI